MTPPPAAAAAAPAAAPRTRRPAPKRVPQKGRSAAKRPASKRAAATRAATARPVSRRSSQRPKMTVYRSGNAIPVAAHAGAAAAGRIGAVVVELPDSGLVHRLTQGRAWIAVLGALLAGIVALNVLSLSFTTAAGTAGQKIDELEQANSALRTDLAEKIAAPTIENAAARYGMTRPQADDITYIGYKAEDLIRAAKVLAGEIVAAVEAWTPPSLDAAYSGEATSSSGDAPPASSGSILSGPDASGTEAPAAPSSSSPSSSSPSTSTPAPSSSGSESSSSGGVGPGL